MTLKRKLIIGQCCLFRDYLRQWPFLCVENIFFLCDFSLLFFWIFTLFLPSPGSYTLWNGDLSNDDDEKDKDKDINKDHHKEVREDNQKEDHKDNHKYNYKYDHKDNKKKKKKRI